MATHLVALRDLLSIFGAEPTSARVVTDGNLITGGGVTAGIDFGLTLLAELVNTEAAELAQLSMEYDPEPPFNSGSPLTADPDLVAVATKFMAPLLDAVRPVLSEPAVELCAMTTEAEAVLRGR
ncbi:hypothetical protein DEJ13_01105 [Curtobacterium sp. MCLR17_007]|uniref:hypothetical protein n=1 Tax=Curtobacterium sp. MCLR17_007 TaxID=2175648 RepID=UPI000DA780D2|nr:hypothetical protein [Curtobacterium sp. MCLR17_007]WIB60452.1 hypothetical protein DEJ13_01105 [Curtobacterium sp. MCLR17_007]